MGRYRGSTKVKFGRCYFSNRMEEISRSLTTLSTCFDHNSSQSTHFSAVADYHDLQIDEISLLVHKANHIVRSSVIWSTVFSVFRNFRPFPRLVRSCINADFCVQDVIFQCFSSFTCFPLKFEPVVREVFIFQCLCTVFRSRNLKNRKKGGF
jgi:hypothetical protein